MDVSCPQCSTEYEFEDARIPADGLTVKCTQCGHVFRMKKKAPELPRPTDESQPGREWRLRQASGVAFSFRRLTTLQKWIVERKVHKEDEISLTGDSWKRLGEIAELASFFQVVDDALRAEQRAVPVAPPAAEPDPYAKPPPPRLAPDPYRAPPEPSRHPHSDTLQGGKFGPLTPVPPPAPAPVQVAAAPAPVAALPPAPVQAAPPPPRRAPPPPVIRAAQPPSDDEEEIKLPGQGGLLKWVVVSMLILGAGGAGGYYYLQIWQPEQLRLATEKQEQEDAKAAQEKIAAQQKATEEAARLKAEELAAAAAIVDAGAEVAVAPVAPVAPAVVDAGAPAVVVDAGVVEPPRPIVPPKPKDFDQLMAEGERLRSKDRAAAALAAFAKAAELKPDRAEPQASGGLVLLDMEKPRDAEAAFRGALKLNARYGPALIGMAEASRALGKNEQAIEFYEKYIDVLPNGPEAAAAKRSIERLKSP